MHTYEENPGMYIHLCSNALETGFQMVSIYVAQRFLAELLQFIEDIKRIKKKSKKLQDKQREKELEEQETEQEEDAMQTSLLFTKIMGPPQFQQVCKCKITYEKLTKAPQSIHLTLLYEEGQWISL